MEMEGYILFLSGGITALNEKIRGKLQIHALEV